MERPILDDLMFRARDVGEGQWEARSEKEWEEAWKQCDAILALAWTRLIRVGDHVANRYGVHATRGCPLVSGCGAYGYAIVVQQFPLVLVSAEGGMMWSCIKDERRHLIVVGHTYDRECPAFQRFRREGRWAEKTP